MNRFGVIGSGQRLTCAACGTRLAIRGARINAALVALLAAIGAIVVLTAESSLADTYAKGILFIAILPLAFLHQWLAPRLARLEVPVFGEVDRTPLDVELSRLNSLEATIETLDPPMESPTGPGVKWCCDSRREENPERFEICWKCGADWETRSGNI